MQHAGFAGGEIQGYIGAGLAGATGAKHRADLGDLLGQATDVGIGKAGRFGKQTLLAPHHIADPRHQFVGIEGLGDVVIRPGLEAGDAVGRHALGGEKHHRRTPQSLIPPQALEQAKAIAARHHHVRDHHIGQHLLRHRPALLAVVGGGHLEALVFEVGLDGRAHARFVVHQQQPHRRAGDRRCAGIGEAGRAGGRDVGHWRNLSGGGGDYLFAFRQLARKTQLPRRSRQNSRVLARLLRKAAGPPHHVIQPVGPADRPPRIQKPHNHALAVAGDALRRLGVTAHHIGGDHHPVGPLAPDIHPPEIGGARILLHTEHPHAEVPLQAFPLLQDHQIGRPFRAAAGFCRLGWGRRPATGQRHGGHFQAGQQQADPQPLARPGGGLRHPVLAAGPGAPQGQKS